MEELIEKKLNNKLHIQSLYEKERIHSVYENIAHKKRHSCYKERQDYKDIRKAFILHFS